MAVGKIHKVPRREEIQKTKPVWYEYLGKKLIEVDLIDLYFELNGINMLLKKQIIHIIYNELTASEKQGSSNVNNMFCALEY